ncbi:MAG TPA: ROK family transcriptional regulator [Spirochaetia bacterium]|nr:ROK family transcriptional regulator [Spirochaetia bacterium]
MNNKLNEINVSRVLQKLWFSTGISRVEIARELGLGKSTVTNIVSALMKRNLVRRMKAGESGPSGGRRPTHLSINGRYGYILGIEIETDHYTAVAADMLGELIMSDSGRMRFDTDIVSTFLDVSAGLRKKTARIGLPLIGIGVGTAGIIDPHKGVIEKSNPLNIHEPVDFYRGIAARQDVPVLIENDAKCCCWGELAFKKTERHTNFLFVLGEFREGRTVKSGYWGIAVGLAFVLNGRVHYGEDFSAGEFQSILWKEPNQGQFSLTDAASRTIRKDHAVLARVLRELCAHIAFLVNMLNLTCVVFGGEVSAYKDELRRILPEEIRRNWSYENTVDCSIEFATLGEKAVAYGAAGMFLERFFSIPDFVDSTEQKIASKIGALFNPGQR